MESGKETLIVLREARKKKSRNWTIKFSFNTYEEIQTLKRDEDLKEVVIEAINTLEKDPYANGTRAIKKSKKNMRRIRAGEYRIFYRVKDFRRLVSIVLVALRKDIQYDSLEKFQQEIL